MDEPRELPDHVFCPCCDDLMESTLVACWTCYKASHRLEPGTHPNPGLSGSFTITQADVARWDAARFERHGY